MNEGSLPQFENHPMKLLKNLAYRLQPLLWILLLMLIIATALLIGKIYPSLRDYPGPVCTIIGGLVVIWRWHVVMATLTDSGFMEAVKLAWNQLRGRPKSVDAGSMHCRVVSATDIVLSRSLKENATMEEKVDFLLRVVEENAQELQNVRQELKAQIRDISQTGQKTDQQRKEQIWSLEMKVKDAFLDGVEWQLFAVILAIFGTLYGLVV